MPRVAIIVPWYRPNLTEDEQISVQQLLRHLGERTIIVLKPEHLPGTLAGRPTEEFPDRHFESVATYSQLLLSPQFYDRFARFDWLLLYQLDALVLADRIDDWLDMPWDYVGAPWLIDPQNPERGFSRVGNGGFCLRRVEACLEVLRQAQSPGAVELLLHGSLPDQAHHPLPARLSKKLRVARQVSRGVAWYAANYTLNEDHFWSDRAHLFGTGFSVAPVQRGLEFAIECAPRRALQETGGRLPFGVHAWAKHDRALWEPYLASTTEASRASE